MTARPIHARDGSRVFALQRGPAKPSAKRATPEADFQIALVSALDIALPVPYMVFASMVGTNVGRYKGGDLKAMGVRADMADLQVLNFATGGSRFLECKSLVGSLSPGQRLMRDRLGDKWATVKTLDQAQAALLAWRVPLRMPLRFANRYQAPMWTRMTAAQQAAEWGVTPRVSIEGATRYANP